MCFHKRSNFFFYSTVKGVMPKVGEKVLVEATFNPNMPFKWNATRVQPLPNQVRVCKYLFKEFAGGNFFSTICNITQEEYCCWLVPTENIFIHNVG